jgi:CRP-like cAMP-binding protein
MEVAQLARLPFFGGIPPWALVRLAEPAGEEELPPGGTVVHQYDRARAAHFLLAGSVQILLRVGDEDLLVATMSDPGELIGWSAFRPPYRYTASVRCETACRLLRVPAAAFEGVFAQDPALAYQILQRVAASLATRLEHARARLLAAPRQGPVGEAR